MHDSPRIPRFSIVIVVRDAADALRLTLASIREMADEVVVLDTGSTDQSREVARESGAKLNELPWADDFSAARNHAAQRATGDWLLWLDAGETLSDADADDLKRFVASEADTTCVYMMLVRVPGADSQAPDEQIGRIRLIPRHAELRFVGRVRESCEASLSQAGLQLQGLPYVIRRSEREHDLHVKKRRAERNMRLAELECRETVPSARLWNCLGESCQLLGEDRRAEECFQKALATAPQGAPEALEAWYGLLTLPYENDSKDLLLRRCVEALETFPLDAQLLCALAGYLHARGQGELALQTYSTAYLYGQVQPRVWHVAEIRDIAAVCYSVALQVAQRLPEAIEFLEEALQECPKSLRIRRRLLDLYVEQGQRESALAQVNALPRTTPHLEALRSAVRGACYASQRNWIAAKAYLNAAYSHGCRDVLCLKWLVTTMLASGEREAARPFIQEWSTAEPRNPEPARLLAGLPSTGVVEPPIVRVDAGQWPDSLPLDRAFPAQLPASAPPASGS